MDKDILLQHAFANFIVKADAMKHMWFDHRTATLWHINELMGIQNSLEVMATIMPVDDATKDIWNALRYWSYGDDSTGNMEWLYNTLKNFDPLKASFEVIETKITKY